jgi:hypothetical protein
MMAPTKAPTDPMLAQSRVVEWAPPVRQRTGKPNPFAALVAEAAKDGKAHALDFTLEGEGYEAQSKEVGNLLRRLRSAAGTLEGDRKIAAYASEVQDNAVTITFKVLPLKDAA